MFTSDCVDRAAQGEGALRGGEEGRGLGGARHAQWASRDAGLRVGHTARSDIAVVGAQRSVCWHRCFRGVHEREWLVGSLLGGDDLGAAATAGCRCRAANIPGVADAIPDARSLSESQERPPRRIQLSDRLILRRVAWVSARIRRQ